MSTPEPIASGIDLLSYRLVEKIGTFVWRATDSRSGKDFALKILTRQLPADLQKREEVFKHVRVRAALYQPFLVPILDVIVAGDALLLVMELVSGEPLHRFLGGKARPAAEVYRIAYQIAEAVKFLQQREMVHGNVNGDSVIVQADGHVRLAGLNLTNIMRRKEGAASPVFQQRGSDPRCVAFMAPEQIGEQPVDFRSDVFSLGVVMYETATGATPWNGANAAEIARSIVEGQPRSPRSIAADIDPVLVDVMAHCLARDPFQRYKDMRAAVDQIARVAPDAARFAGEIASRVNASVAGVAAVPSEPAVLFLADVDVPEGEERTAATAKMQQIVGEAVYLFDGRIVDPFGARLVAEMPTHEAGVEAGRKAEFDLIAAELEGDEIPVRMLLHTGAVELREGNACGEAVERGFRALSGAPHRQLLISEEFLRRGRGTMRLRDAGARGGMKLFAIAEAAPVPKHETLPAAESVSTAALPMLPPRGARKKKRIAAVVIGLFLLVAGIAGVIASGRIKAVRKPAGPVVPVAQGPREIVVAPFSVEGAEPVMIERANAIRMAALEILRQSPRLHILEAATPKSVVFAAVLKTATVPPQLVPNVGAVQGAAIPLSDDATAVRGFADWVAHRSNVRVLPATTPVALNAFTAALAARAADDKPRTEAALREAIAADPNFLPAQLMAMEFFSSAGNDEAALAAATQVLELAPAQIGAARLIARAKLARGDVPAALNACALILHQSPNDVEALNTIGHYAWSAGDARHFTAALQRLTPIAPREVSLHAPDLLLAEGRFDEAVQKYYDLEVETPNNAALTLKIGRIAVLRHTAEIARIELGKLQTSDPSYGYHILAAYVEAGENHRAEAASELSLALKASRPGDTYWTSAAEVHAMLGHSKEVVSALQTAADRREPSIAYVLADPLFDYLSSDAKFQQLRTTLVQRQAEIRAALAKIAI